MTTRPMLRRPSSRRRRAGAGSVAARAVAHLIDLGTTAGVGRGILMEAAGVSDDDLREPDTHLPVAAEVAIWQALARRVPDPGFGVRSGSGLRVREVGLLGYVACFSPTLRDALRRVQRYGRVFTEAVEFEFHDGRPQMGLARCHPTLGDGQRLAQDYRLAAVIALCREITGADIVPAQVSLTYAEPSSTAAHRQFFRCPLRFSAPKAGILFRAHDLDLPLSRADETLAGYLSKYAEEVLASLVQGDTMRQRVRAAIWSLLGDGAPSLTEVAAILHLPARTLQRQLADEGTSMQAEVEEIRKRMALAVLRDRSIAIGDVAFLLGYAEPSAFFRSFKRWTGTTPRRFRDHAA